MRGKPKLKKLFIAAVLLGATLFAQAAQADTRCRNVRLSFYNETGKQIRIYRIRYYDIEDQVMRTNDILNADIPDGGIVSVYETLEYVGNEAIGDISVQFRLGSSGGRQWSDPKPTVVDYCVRNDSISHMVTLQ